MFAADAIPLSVLSLQVRNPFAIDWSLLQAMSAAEQLLVSGALLCLFREIFVKSATVRALHLKRRASNAHYAFIWFWAASNAVQIGAYIRDELRRLVEFHFACVQPAMEGRAV